MATNAKISDLTEKATPADADDFILDDDSGSETKKIGWDNLKAAVLTYIKSQLGVGVDCESLGGSGTSRTLAHTPISGTLIIFDSGVHLKEGAGEDYTVSGTTVTFAVAPSDPIAYYRYAP